MKQRFFFVEKRCLKKYFFGVFKGLYTGLHTIPFENSWPSFCQIWIIFTHLKLCIASARHNFKWVKIIQIWQNEGQPRPTHTYLSSFMLRIWITLHTCYINVNKDVVQNLVICNNSQVFDELKDSNKPSPHCTSHQVAEGGSIWWQWSGVRHQSDNGECRWQCRLAPDVQQAP